MDVYVQDLLCDRFNHRTNGWVSDWLFCWGLPNIRVCRSLFMHHPASPRKDHPASPRKDHPIPAQGLWEVWLPLFCSYAVEGAESLIFSLKIITVSPDFSFCPSPKTLFSPSLISSRPAGKGINWIYKVEVGILGFICCLWLTSAFCLVFNISWILLEFLWVN